MQDLTTFLEDFVATGLGLNVLQGIWYDSKPDNMTLLSSSGYPSHIDDRDACFPNTSNIIFVVPNEHPAQQLCNALVCSMR
jgi:hypothetical protein